MKREAESAVRRGWWVGQHPPSEGGGGSASIRTQIFCKGYPSPVVGRSFGGVCSVCVNMGYCCAGKGVGGLMILCACCGASPLKETHL